MLQGSSIVFDYAITAFINGDTSTYGGRQVARWLEKIREPFLFGLDPAETPEFLKAHALDTVSDLGPEDLATTYLKARDGRCIGMTFGHVRMVHARATGARKPAASPVAWENAGPRYEAAARKDSIRELNDALRQTLAGGRVLLSPGVLSLPVEANAELLERVRSFTAFDPDNDAEHGFGRFDFAGVAYCFELECCSRTHDGAKEAVDAGKGTRALTVMRADEY